MIAADNEPCGNVVVNQTNVTCPEVVACLPFATPAETVAGTSTTTIVNPADLYARENMPAQTGLGLVLSSIPAPTASQSNWGVNTLGETLHYMPGVGWKIVADLAHTETVNTVGAGFPFSNTAFSYVAPRAGTLFVSATFATLTDLSQNPNIQAGIAKNGLTIAEDRDHVTSPDQGASVSASASFPVLLGDVITVKLYGRGAIAPIFINTTQTHYLS